MLRLSDAKASTPVAHSMPKHVRNYARTSPARAVSMPHTYERSWRLCGFVRVPAPSQSKLLTITKFPVLAANINGVLPRRLKALKPLRSPDTLKYLSKDTAIFQIMSSVLGCQSCASCTGVCADRTQDQAQELFRRNLQNTTRKHATTHIRL